MTAMTCSSWLYCVWFIDEKQNQLADKKQDTHQLS